MITDCHIHIQPFDAVNPQAFEMMRHGRADWEQVLEYTRSPRKLLSYLDACGVQRAVLINYVAPEVIGMSAEVNRWVADYCKEDPRRLLACGSVHPRHTKDARDETEALVRLGIRMIKIHPPHQLFFPNDYRNGLHALQDIYSVAAAHGVPVMFHTGTSRFPGARSKFGDPMPLDDVAVDFPALKMILAHGGRPLWYETSFFLLRRHRNLYFDISSIPPRNLLRHFPRLEEIAHKTLFGSDWPGPGVPGIGENLAEFRALPLSAAAMAQILEKTALELWPAEG